MLESLPDAALSHAATYLPRTTRALLAAALTAPSSSWERRLAERFRGESVGRDTRWRTEDAALAPASRVVVAAPFAEACPCREYERGKRQHADSVLDGEWSVLNFMDVEVDVRRRLTDGDVGGVLACINAIENVRVLRLPTCINVRGRGLAPLWGSVVLKMVDLGLMSTDQDGSFEDMKPKISGHECLSLIGSILIKESHSLTRLHLPEIWGDRDAWESCDYGDGPDQNELMAQFLNNRVRDNDMWTVQFRSGCHECDRDFMRNFPQRPLHVSVDIGSALKGCESEHRRKYCVERCHDYLFVCDECGKTRCDGCVERYHCSRCKKELCTICKERFYCQYDFQGCLNLDICSDCLAEDKGEIRKCIRCEYSFCTKCSGFQLSDDGLVCEECLGVVVNV